MQNAEKQSYFSVPLAYGYACICSLSTNQIIQFDLGTLLYIKYSPNVASKVFSPGLFLADAQIAVVFIPQWADL